VEYDDPIEDEIEDLTEPPEESSGLDDDEIASIAKNELESAASFIDDTIAPEREKATKYYLGEPFGNEETGRSQVVDLAVRDTISAVIPSLLRIFSGGEKVVEFLPHGPEDVEPAEQATDYVNYIFQQENQGFSVLADVMHDSLVSKVGIAKFWWSESMKTSTEKLSGLDQGAVEFLASDPRVELQEMQIETELDPMGQPMGPPVYSCTVLRSEDQGRVRVEAVPPEEFLINSEAKTLADATVVGHRTYLTVSDLVEMGYDEDDALQHAEAGDDKDFSWNSEKDARQPDRRFERASRSDDAARLVQYTEAWIKADVQGTGVAELIKCCCVGSSYKMLRWEPASTVPFATFCPIPQPHTFFGLSLADQVMDIQRVKSTVMRSMLDSLALSIHPRMAISEGQVSISDALNTETGAIIRCRGSIPNAIQPLSMPFVGRDAFPVLQYLDELRENRTGVTKAAAGLDPGALQSSSATAVNATMSQAQQHIEKIARVFSETGMKQLFQGILKLVCQHQDQPKMIRLRNKFVPMDPKSWNSGMDMISNVALGRGTDQERMMMLQQIASKQEQLIERLGPQNALVTPKQYRHTLAKIIELAGFKNPDQFINQIEEGQPLIPPEVAKNQKPSADELLAQVQVKAIEADIQKKVAELQLRREEMIRKDDREKDQLDADIELRAAEIEGKHGAAVDVAGIRAQVDVDREMVRGMQQVAAERRNPPPAPNGGVQ